MIPAGWPQTEPETQPRSAVPSAVEHADWFAPVEESVVLTGPDLLDPQNDDGRVSEASSYLATVPVEASYTGRERGATQRRFAFVAVIAAAVVIGAGVALSVQALLHKSPPAVSIVSTTPPRPPARGAGPTGPIVAPSVVTPAIAVLSEIPPAPPTATAPAPATRTGTNHLRAGDTRTSRAMRGALGARASKRHGTWADPFDSDARPAPGRQSNATPASKPTAAGALTKSAWVDPFAD